MQIRKGIWLTGMVLAGSFTVGCASDDDGYRYNDPSLSKTQQTSSEAERARVDTAGQQPYSPLKGETTGDGLRVDRRAGGSITGTDVTSGERAQGNQQTPTEDFERDRAPIPTKPGSGNLKTGPGTPDSGAVTPGQ